MQYHKELIKTIKELDLIYFTKIAIENNNLVLHSTYTNSSYVSTREMITLSELINSKIYDIQYFKNTIIIKEKI